jgi:hypothetical protein
MIVPKAVYSLLSTTILHLVAIAAITPKAASQRDKNGSYDAYSGWNFKQNLVFVILDDDSVYVPFVDQLLNPFDEVVSINREFFSYNSSYTSAAHGTEFVGFLHLCSTFSAIGQTFRHVGQNAL